MISAVPSVLPSSTTRISKSSRTVASTSAVRGTTCARLGASLKAGMITVMPTCSSAGTSGSAASSPRGCALMVPSSGMSAYRVGAAPGGAPGGRCYKLGAMAPSPEPAAPLRLLWLGTYERDYTRTRVLMAGLRELGVEVLECHRPLWELTRHKAGSFLSPRGLPRIAGRFAFAWGSIAAEQRRLPAVDAVVAGYPHQPDALPAFVFARGRRVPLVVDAMISMFDTLAGDRRRVGATTG